MDLISEIRKLDLPPLYSAEDELDPVLQAKLFYPDFHWTWYLAEFDGDHICFGFVVGDFPELGYFSLHELIANCGHLGLSIEIDRGFKPQRLSEIQKSL